MWFRSRKQDRPPLPRPDPPEGFAADPAKPVQAAKENDRSFEIRELNRANAKWN